MCRKWVVVQPRGTTTVMIKIVVLRSRRLVPIRMTRPSPNFRKTTLVWRNPPVTKFASLWVVRAMGW